MTAKVLRGSFGAIQEQSIQAKETRPRQEELAGKTNQGTSRPRQEELAGKANQGKALKETRPRQEELAGKPVKNEVIKPRRQGPGRRSFPGRTRPRQEELAEKANQGISRNLPRRATRPGEAR